MSENTGSDVDPSAQASQYTLAIDEQVEKFVDIKQKLTYFLVTASVAVVAFLVSFVADNPTVGDLDAAEGARLALLVTSALAGFSAAGLALINLHLEHRSYSRHLKYRYQRKDWDDLTKKEQDRWDVINKAASWCLLGAFTALAAEILFAVVFFLNYFS